MRSMLVILHCESNTGYAIAPLEATFFRMAVELTGDVRRVHFGYPSMAKGPTPNLPADFGQYLIVDTRSANRQHWEKVASYIRSHDIDTVFGFDQPVRRGMYPALRRAGVRTFISYWGAPMSSISPWWKLILKRIEVGLSVSGPDYYVFESRGMQEMAVRGRGIPGRRTTVVPLGVDTARFRPASADAEFAREEFGIPAGRKIFFYAGHMEPRKGVSVIMRAANELARSGRAADWHVLLFGNKPGEEMPHVALLSPEAARHVTFGGYRPDLDRIQRGCYAAIIASTGWDSFPRTGIEVQSSGLPLLASGLPGLREAVGETSGFLFEPGNASELARLMVRLLDEEGLQARLSAGARARATSSYSLETQYSGLLAAARAAGKATGNAQ